MSKERHGGYRNLLYEEPSAVGALIAVGMLFAFGVIVLVVLLV